MAAVADPVSTPSAASREIRAGSRLPVVTMPVTLQKLVISAGGQRDFNPIHYDAEAAQAAGMRTAFANTFFQQGLLNRAVNDWAGTSGHLRRLALSMRAPIYLGSTLVVSGMVTGVHSTAEGAADEIEVVLELATEDGVCSEATATVVIVHRETRTVN
jgi:acyl dehydratase